MAASSINVFEEVDRASDPRKFSFVSKGREMRDAFCSEVVAVVSLCRQFEDALAALLATQKQVCFLCETRVDKILNPRLKDSRRV